MEDKCLTLIDRLEPSPSDIQAAQTMIMIQLGLTQEGILMPPLVAVLAREVVRASQLALCRLSEPGLQKQVAASSLQTFSFCGRLCSPLNVNQTSHVVVDSSKILTQGSLVQTLSADIIRAFSTMLQAAVISEDALRAARMALEQAGTTTQVTRATESVLAGIQSRICISLGPGACIAADRISIEQHALINLTSRSIVNHQTAALLQIPEIRNTILNASATASRLQQAIASATPSPALKKTIDPKMWGWVAILAITLVIASVAMVKIATVATGRIIAAVICSTMVTVGLGITGLIMTSNLSQTSDKTRSCCAEPWTPDEMICKSCTN